MPGTSHGHSQRRSSSTVCLLGLIMAISLLCLVLDSKPAAQTPPPPSGPVKLAVLVVFDQMRADYLTRWQDLYGKDGFRRLEEEGAWFKNCHYPFAVTKTAAGHASIMTGCSPAVHGIIDNDWYDRAAGRIASAVGSERHERVPPLATAAFGSSPELLLAPSVGDSLKATHAKSRILSMSFKDRSAILPGGKKADASYWFDTSSGLFVTSSYYRHRLHPWVDAFNRSRFADQWVGKNWTPFRADLDYGHVLSRDGDVIVDDKPTLGDSVLFEKGKKLGADYYKWLYISPFSNDMLLELAKRAIDEEKLGQRDEPDLLCISFSGNDAIGHVWGPDSREMLDVTLRSDVIIKELLDHLDLRVGKGRYVLAMTADHGVCPLVETSKRRNREAGRVSNELLKASTNDFLSRTYAPQGEPTRWVDGVVEPWIYLNRALLHDRKLDQAEVEKTLADWLRQQPGIQAAYTRSQLLRGIPEDDAVGQSVRLSFHPERSGDVMVVLKPYHLFSISPQSPVAWLLKTTHGTPHEYDTHVPLLVYGPGVRPGVHQEAVAPQCVAPILAHFLNVPVPGKAVAKLPESMSGKGEKR